MEKIAAQFQINFYQYITAQNQVLDPLPEFATNLSHLQSLYRWMVLTRVFDNKAIALQRTGKLGTYASSLGQEAVSTGIGHALHSDDVFCACYRDYAVQFIRGVQMEEILSYWGGSEQGNNFKAASVKEDLPNCVPIGSQCLHAAGVAAAIQIRGQARAVVVTCGDGATSQGDFYEAVNVAGAWQLPLIIVINNNQWAISISRHKQTAAQTLAQKGIAGGIACEQVDGNDVIAVQDRLSNAITKARSGNGPTIIEALTYRLSDHTTADDASRYRHKDELAQAWQNEPIIRLRNYLLEQNAWSENQEKQLQQECSMQVEQAVTHYLNATPEKLSSMFDYQYAVLPLVLQKQRAEINA